MSDRIYHCWAHSEGHTRDDGTEVSADTAREAANRFARDWFMKSGDFGDLEIVVCTERNGEEPPKVRAFSVYVEMELNTTVERIAVDGIATTMKSQT